MGTQMNCNYFKKSSNSQSISCSFVHFATTNKTRIVFVVLCSTMHYRE